MLVWSHLFTVDIHLWAILTHLWGCYEGCYGYVMGLLRGVVTGVPFGTMAPWILSWCHGAGGWKTGGCRQSYRIQGVPFGTMAPWILAWCRGAGVESLTNLLHCLVSLNIPVFAMGMKRRVCL